MASPFPPFNFRQGKWGISSPSLYLLVQSGPYGHWSAAPRHRRSATVLFQHREELVRGALVNAAPVVKVLTHTIRLTRLVPLDPVRTSLQGGKGGPNPVIFGIIQSNQSTRCKDIHNMYPVSIDDVNFESHICSASHEHSRDGQQGRKAAAYLISSQELDAPRLAFLLQLGLRAHGVVRPTK